MKKALSLSDSTLFTKCSLMFDLSAKKLLHLSLYNPGVKPFSGYKNLTTVSALSETTRLIVHLSNSSRLIGTSTQVSLYFDSYAFSY